MTALVGQCLCGAVSVTVAAHDPRIGACHCGMCQRWTGGLFLSFDAAADQVSVTGPVARYASSEFSERAFCAVCGTHLWMHDTADAAASYDLMPGLFDAAREWPLRSEIYVDRAIAAVRLAGDHRRETAAEYEAAHLHVGSEGRQ